MLFNGHIFTNQYGENFRRVNKTEARNLAGHLPSPPQRVAVLFVGDGRVTVTFA